MTIRLVPSGLPEHRVTPEVKVERDDYGHSSTTFQKGLAAKVTVPGMPNAYGRVIRAHELLHVGQPPPRIPSGIQNPVYQSCLDAALHTLHWRPHMCHLDRDARSLAIRHILRIGRFLRGATQTAKPGEPIPWYVHNACILDLFRAYSILFGTLPKRHSEIHDNLPNCTRSPQLAKAHLSIAGALSGHFVSHFEAAWACLQNGDFSRACRLIQGLLKAPSPVPGAPHHPAEMEDEEPEGHDPLGNLVKRCSVGDADSYDNPMHIERLPMTEECHPGARRAHWELRSSGIRIRSSRLATCRLNRHRIFQRRRTQVHGTVLIDGSGSMGFSRLHLNSISRRLPFGTVAYYCGHRPVLRSDGTTYWGTLSIYAEDGLRATDAPRRGGDNSVDYYALQWLLRQPPPHIFITDLGFCSGPDGQDTSAHNLLRELGPRVTVYNSFPSAQAAIPELAEPT